MTVMVLFNNGMTTTYHDITEIMPPTNVCEVFRLVSPSRMVYLPPRAIAELQVDRSRDADEQGVLRDQG